jgi:hypothetical protein
MVVDTEGNIKLIIEIEDKSQPSPKMLLGVLFSIVLCNQFAFGVGQKKRIFNVIPKTKLILAGFVNPKGRKWVQIFDVIQPRLKEVNTSNFSISFSQLIFVYEKDFKTTIKRLKQMVIYQFS